MSASAPASPRRERPAPGRRRRLGALLALGVWIALVPQPAASTDRVALADLVRESTRYDGRDVIVEGVAGPYTWVQMTVLGNPPYQGVFPVFILSDGKAAVWVIIFALLTPPIAGSQIEVHGTYRAAYQSIEVTHQPFRYR